MSTAVDALRSDRDELLRICDGFSPGEWAAPSGCPGWSVQDLVSHLAVLYWAAVDPSALPDVGHAGTERSQDIYVESRRGMAPAQVLDDYRAVSEKAFGVLADLSEADFDIPLGDIGTYPASLVPNAYVFDHYTHIRADLFTPRGPLEGPTPAAGRLHMSHVLDWIEAALPQQNAVALGALIAPVEISVKGSAPRTIRLGPEGPPAARVESDFDNCVRWTTQRGTWEELGVAASGHEQVLAVVRGLKVF